LTSEVVTPKNRAIDAPEYPSPAYHMMWEKGDVGSNATFRY
jgi:aminoglycoside phosphotransferase (APT) family kinase protein